MTLKKHISLNVIFDPQNEFMRCSGFLGISMLEKDFSFYLNKSLSLTSTYILVGGLEKPLEVAVVENTNEMLQVASKYEVKFPHPPDDQKIYFSYEGSITSDHYGTNYLKPEAIELGLYAPWYPFPGLGVETSFDVTIVGPDTWVFLMNGELLSPDSWRNEGNPSDLTLLGLPKRKHISEGQFYWGTLGGYEKFRRLERDLLKRKKILEDWLGPSTAEKLTFAFTHRDTGGTYVREGLVVTQENIEEEYLTEKRDFLLMSWTHELAHLWFNKATTADYHNWVDEGLADFVALLVSREFAGEEFVTTRLERLRTFLDKQHDLPSIVETTRGDPHAYAVYYVWGSLIYNEICQRVGLDMFKRFLRDFALKEREVDHITTSDMIEVLEMSTGQEWQVYVEQMMKRKPSTNLG